jgi:tRNA-splicing ligase RtcB
MRQAMRQYHIHLPDEQLACAPFESAEAQAYLGAMACAVNYAFANRQCITHSIRQAFERVFGRGAHKLGLDLVYDVAHNIVKVEEHQVGGRTQTVCVHRKGATRAFPPGHPDLPAEYQETGQPVLVPGSMGSHSYLLVGTATAMEETFGSTCHGAGRVLSRNQALKQTQGRNITRELAEQGIVLRAASKGTVGEEAPVAYKDVTSVVDTCQAAGISRKVARMRPLGVVKG